MSKRKRKTSVIRPNIQGNIASDVLETPRTKICILSEREFELTCIRRRIIQLKADKYSQSMTLKQIQSEGFPDATIYTVKNNWNKTMDDIFRGASTGRPRVRTPTTSAKMRSRVGSRTQSVREQAKAFKAEGKDISYSSISRDYIEAGLPALKIPKCSSFKEQHAEARLKFAEKYVDEPIATFWSNTSWSDEKYVANGGIRNRQNNRIRCASVFDIDDEDYVHLSKFAQKRICWGAVSSFRLSKCMWLPEKRNVDAHSYHIYVLKGEVSKWKNRRARSRPLCQRKLWNDNRNWIFQQDHASAHKTVKVDNYCKNNLPRYSAILDRYKTSDDVLFFPSKMDDVSPIERVWAYCSNEMDRIYKNKSSDVEQHIKRWNEVWRDVSPEFVVRICHQVPSRLYAIIQREGINYRVVGRQMQIILMSVHVEYVVIDLFLIVIVIYLFFGCI